MQSQTTPSAFRRYFLPGFAFKAVVIGGGYATGRELAQYFLPSGPRGGLLGMLLAMALWSLCCVVTFLFARSTHSRDYGTFFRHLLGPAWFLFDVAYACAVLVGLSVFGAAAGAIVAALFGWPEIVGTLGLIAGIAAIAAFGNDSVERLFKYATYFLYAVYVLFFVLTFVKCFGRIETSFLTSYPMTHWATGGATYAAYNAVGAVVILPVLRHLTSNKDAVISGLIAGPLAMLPAVLFFICLTAFYPNIDASVLPSDYILRRLNVPVFHFVFQLMILVALLESGTSLVHAINERVAGILRPRGRALSTATRLWISGGMLVVSIFIAARFGLVTLIARGYLALAYVFLAVFVAPLLTYGLWTFLRNRRAAVPADESATESAS
ncbi:MAG: YkvI family membrane protein [Steroidobacteraceae bacterium]